MSAQKCVSDQETAVVQSQIDSAITEHSCFPDVLTLVIREYATYEPMRSRVAATFENRKRSWGKKCILQGKFVRLSFISGVTRHIHIEINDRQSTQISFERLWRFVFDQSVATFDFTSPGYSADIRATVLNYIHSLT